jgi:hypothetical protein
LPKRTNSASDILRTRVRSCSSSSLDSIAIAIAGLWAEVEKVILQQLAAHSLLVVA